MKSNVERRREYYREGFEHESGGKRERKQGLEICGEKEIWSENGGARHMKVTAGKMCAIADFC